MRARGNPRPFFVSGGSERLRSLSDPSGAEAEAEAEAGTGTETETATGKGTAGDPRS